MVATKPTGRTTRKPRGYTDFVHTGPGTLAGRYLRMFWHPVYHSSDLPVGRARPIRIMGQNFTLFRGERGAPHLLDFRCPHRGMQLSPGWVEGDSIRCFYHGWRYDETGQCVEQPAEPKPFCQKVRIGSYPVREYLGFVFAYLGDGEPPAFPRYPDFEDPQAFLEWDSYNRRCNYFNNFDNAGDSAHAGFVHMGEDGTFDGRTAGPVHIKAEESDWGITIRNRVSQRGEKTAQIGMPNMLRIQSIPIIRGSRTYRRALFWWVPTDDENHVQFSVYAVRMPPDEAAVYMQRRDEAFAKRVYAHEDLGDQVLAGKPSNIWDIPREVTDYVRLQDDVAQVGQSAIPDRRHDRLGRTDNCVILGRKIWTRELRALAEGRPVKQWKYDVEEMLTADKGVS